MGNYKHLGLLAAIFEGISSKINEISNMDKPTESLNLVSNYPNPGLHQGEMPLL